MTTEPLATQTPADLGAVLSAFSLAVATAVNTGGHRTSYKYNSYQIQANNLTYTVARPVPDIGTDADGALYVNADCSTWMNAALSSVSPLHAAILSVERNDPIFNPLPGYAEAYDAANPGTAIQVPLHESFQPWARANVLAHFFGEMAQTTNGFSTVAGIADLQAGDMLAWSLGIYADPAEADSAADPTLTPASDTGHVVTVVGAPVLYDHAVDPTNDYGLGRDPATGDYYTVYAVPTVDASIVPHIRTTQAYTPPLADNRDYTDPNGAGGLGTGSIFVSVDSTGAFRQFRFDLGDTWHANTEGLGNAPPNQRIGIAAARMTDTVTLAGAMLDAGGDLVVNLLPNALPSFDGTTYDGTPVDITGDGGLRLTGRGRLTLAGDSSYSGGTDLTGTTKLVLGSDTAAGTGAITFAAGGRNRLELRSGVAIDNTLAGFSANDRIVLDGVAAKRLAFTADHVLRIRTRSGALEELTFAADFDPQGLTFRSRVTNGNTEIRLARRSTPGSGGSAGGSLVDAADYLGRNPDVLKADMDAGTHYATYGWREGRDPNALFSTCAYLAANPDVAKAGINPLEHYAAHGWREGRDPSAAFSGALYRARNPDVAAAGLDPLAHYLAYGEAEGRAAIPVVDAQHLVNGFDPTYYALANPDVAASGLNPLKHWQSHGAAEGRDPNAFFDSRAYLAANPDVAAAGVDPLSHYLSTGWREGRDPSSRFDTSAYLGHYADVAAAGVDPLLHFLQRGLAEGRSGFGDGV